VLSCVGSWGEVVEVMLSIPTYQAVLKCSHLGTPRSRGCHLGWFRMTYNDVCSCGHTMKMGISLAKDG